MSDLPWLFPKHNRRLRVCSFSCVAGVGCCYVDWLPSPINCWKMQTGHCHVHVFLRSAAKGVLHAA